MNVTTKAPKTALSNFKKTKIIATVGPSSNNYEAIFALLSNGANAFRLNFSHGTYEEREQQIKWIRRASTEKGKPVGIIQDLQGPKLRLGDFEGIITVNKDQILKFAHKANYETTGVIPTQIDLSKKVKKDETMMLYDGRVRTVITDVSEGVVYAKAQNEGFLTKRKAINLPDTDFDGDVITKKDREDVAFGSTKDIDFVAQSFVQTADDIYALKKILKNLGSNAKVIAKIETKLAVKNIEEIVQASDLVMVARGDLAVETSAESVPIVTRRIIGLGRKYAKPTIVATQMLASMVDSPEPTRAEVSDVATAVIVGSDAVMLSDETANGNYPLEAIKTMKKIIRYSEDHSPVRPLFVEQQDETTKQAAISSAILNLAEQVHACAIVAETKSGATANNIAARRPAIPTIAVTSDMRVAQQLTLTFGTMSFVRRDEKYQATKLTQWLRANNVLSSGDIIITASGQYPGVVGTTDTIKIRILE